MTLYNKAFFAHYSKRLSQWEPSAAKMFLISMRVKSLVDFGCGAGFFIEEASKLNIETKGLELYLENALPFISKLAKPYIDKVNVEKPVSLPKKYDWAISIEVAEHLKPENSEIFVENLIQASNNRILLTAAPPGQGGTGHINCRPKEFWKKLFAVKGCHYNKSEVDKIRQKWGTIVSPNYGASHILRNLMVFQVAEKLK